MEPSNRTTDGRDTPLARLLPSHLRLVDTEPKPLGVRLLRGVRIMWRRWRRKRERSCIRCGKPAGGTCVACRSRVCPDCTVLSQEFGATIAICLSCSSTTTKSHAPTLRLSGWEMFRSGAVTLGLLLAVITIYAAQSEGWNGAARILFNTLHPAILLGLIPLALVLGAVVSLIRNVFSQSQRPPSI